MERLDMKRHTESAFDRLLMSFDEFDREPAPWEQVALVDALCCIADRQYAMATRKILDVSRSIHLEPASKKHVRVNRDVLRRALNYVRIHR